MLTAQVMLASGWHSYSEANLQQLYYWWSQTISLWSLSDWNAEQPHVQIWARAFWCWPQHWMALVSTQWAKRNNLRFCQWSGRFFQSHVSVKLIKKSFVCSQSHVQAWLIRVHTCVTSVCCFVEIKLKKFGMTYKISYQWKPLLER